MPAPPPGVAAVRLARATLDREIGGRAAPGGESAEAEPPLFGERRGAFVTLRRYPSGALRGCIGFPRGTLPLRRAVPEAALAAARDDPRFRPVGPEELGAVTVEVSILSPPEPLPEGSPADRLAAVRVGRDGLIVEGFGTSGLLLPQVAPEQGWDAEALLDGTCEKAGLPPGSWRDRRVRVYRFRADVCAETAPRGPIVPVPTDAGAPPATESPVSRSAARSAH
jgi:uncharacterized protein (TIGR00296 family)